MQKLDSTCRQQQEANPRPAELASQPHCTAAPRALAHWATEAGVCRGLCKGKYLKVVVLQIGIRGLMSSMMSNLAKRALKCAEWCISTVIGKWDHTVPVCDNLVTFSVYQPGMSSGKVMLSEFICWFLHCVDCCLLNFLIYFFLIFSFLIYFFENRRVLLPVWRL